MSARVWKFPVAMPNEFGRSSVKVPAGARLLSVGMQADQLVVWAVAGDDFNPPESLDFTRELIVANTGMEIPGFLESAVFLGTAVSSNGVVWHVWDAGLNFEEGGF